MVFSTKQNHNEQAFQSNLIRKPITSLTLILIIFQITLTIFILSIVCAKAGFISGGYGDVHGYALQDLGHQQEEHHVRNFTC